MWRGSLFSLLSLLFLLPCSTCQAQDTLRLTLDSCLQYAYGHNSTMQRARLAVERAEVSLHGARWQFLPNINGTAGEYWSRGNGQRTHDFSMGVNASMTLFGGMGGWNNYRQSGLTLRQSRLQMQQSRRTVGEQVGNAYLTLLMTQEKLLYQQRLLENCRQQEAEGHMRHEVGKITESDCLLLEANLRRAEMDTRNLQLTIQECRWALQSLLNLPEGTVLEIVPLDMGRQDTVMPPLDSVMLTALESQPELEAAQVGVEIAQYGVRSARAACYPTLSLSVGGSYYGGSQGFVDALGHIISQGGLNGNIGLSLSIPILNYSSTRTQIRQSRINLREAEVERDRQAQEFRQAVKKIYTAARQSLNSFLAAQQEERAYRANYENYRMRYSEGRVGIVELLQQQDSYLGALDGCLQSKYTHILNMKLLELIQTEP